MPEIAQSATDHLPCVTIARGAYDETDGQVWHVPGFSAFSHRCLGVVNRGRPTMVDHQVEWDTAHDPGLQAIEFIYRKMRIDDEWSIREPRGFTWWGHNLAQRVWAEPARMSAGFAVYRVHAETALLRNLEEQEDLSAKLALFNQMASLSAYVWDPAARRLALRCSIYVHAENLAWLQKILGAAVGIQAADAHIKVGLATMLRGEPDISAHPRSGPRNEADDMLGVIEMFAADGKGRVSVPSV